MTSFLSRIKVKTAVEKSSKMMMKATHLTTSDFGQLGIVKVIEMVPGNKGKAIAKTYSNMQPMPQPTFGEVKYCNAWFWVPYRIVWKSWNDFITDKLHLTATDGVEQLAYAPYIPNNDIVKVLKDNATGSTSADYDFTVCTYGTPPTYTYYKHNDKTKAYYKILCALGMKPNFVSGDNQPVSMLRLLAVARVYYDYYTNNAYMSALGDYIKIGQMFERNGGGSEVYDFQDLKKILDLLTLVNYEPDFFVSCWDRPNHPNIGNMQESDFKIYDPNGIIMTSDGEETTNIISNYDSNDNYKDPYIKAYNNIDDEEIGTHTPTQWALNTLKALTSYLKRHQLAGAGTAMERYLARFGIRLTDEELQRSKFLGKDEWKMEVNTIFSNADTAGSGGENLGSYAGAAYGRTQGKPIEFDIKEYGVLVCLNTIKPIISYPEGFDGMNGLLTKLDWWTPEFDNIGVDPIVAAELKIPDTGADVTLGGKTGNSARMQLFGFLPRYARFKTMKDALSGEYCNPRRKALFDPYTLKREIYDDNNMTDYVHSHAFTIMTDWEDYDRIFYAQTVGEGDKNHYDNFNMVHEIELEMTTKMKPLYDVYDWEHEGGQEIEMQNNGAKF